MICVMGSLVITNGATITIEKGGIIQASTDILQGCKVIVKDGEIVLSGTYFDKNDPLDMNDCVDQMKKELGPDYKIKISVDPDSSSSMDMGDDW